MNQNQLHENFGITAETLNLSDETNSPSPESVISNIRAFFKKVRTDFSKKSEKSVFATLLQNICGRILSSRTRVTAVFLLSFSIVALVISYAINSSLSGFISDIDTFSSLVLLILSAVLFTSNRSFHSLIATSKILGSLSIVYSEQNLTYTKLKGNIYENSYSTPFFLGVICGIFTVIYPVSVICSFIICLICVLLVFNRPECGMLIIISVLPFLSRSMLFVFACVTFLSLLYRYLLGKRHINFDILSLLMLISVIYIAVRCFVVDGDIISRRLYIYSVFFVSCFTAINLIRTTAMFRRTIAVLLRMTRVFAALLVLYYLGNIFFGANQVSDFLAKLNISTLTNSLTDISFIAPFLTIAIPVNFANLISFERNSNTLKNTINLVIIISCLVYITSYLTILICIMSCVAILSFYNKRFIFLAIPAPLAAYAILSLFNTIPSSYRISATAATATNSDYASAIIKLNPLFGSGPEITDFSGNMLINVLMTFGIVGLVLLTCVLIFMLVRAAQPIFSRTMRSSTSRFLSIGLFCAILSFILLCILTDINCNINSIFMFTAIVSASVSSGKCYDADFIDTTIVREYKNK